MSAVRRLSHTVAMNTHHDLPMDSTKKRKNRNSQNLKKFSLLQLCRLKLVSHLLALHSGLSRRSFTHGRRTDFHAVNTLFLLKDLPYLLLLRTSQHDSRAAIRSVPAMLAALVLHSDALAGADPAAVGGQVLVDDDPLDARERSHAGVCAALFRFLRRALHEAVLVRVLAGIGADAAAFERAEDVVGSVVFG